MAYAVEELLTWYPFVPVEKAMQVGPACLHNTQPNTCTLGHFAVM